MQSTEHMGIKKSIAAIVVVVLLAAVVYFFVFHKPAPAPAVLDQFGNPVVAENVGSDLLALLTKLQGVQLNDSIFHEQAFIQLTDYSTTLPVETPGRSDPFGSLNK